jgi:hypothetical protein
MELMAGGLTLEARRLGLLPRIEARQWLDFSPIIFRID